MGPYLFPIVGVLFFGIGGMSIFLARKRFRYARALGQPAIWYKDLGLLTGFEYVLLGLIIYLNLLGSQIPNQSPFRAAIDLIFTGVLILAIILIFVVMFMMFRRRRKPQVLQAATTVEADTNIKSPEERAAEIQRKRERRQKAAAARRRHTGRA